MKNKLLTTLFLIFLAMAVYPQSDLIWYGPIYINPAAPATGDVVTFTATVKATLGNSQPFQVVGGIDGAQLLSTTGPALVKATKKAFSFNWTAVTGNHTVYFDIDPNHTSGDINFKNNHIEVNFSVDTGSTPQPPPRRRGRSQEPNLVIKNVKWNPQTFNQGDKLDFQINVANIGSSPTPISYATLEISGTTYMSCHVSALQPGDTDTVPATGIAHTCPIKVIIRADADNLVTESNEGDNEWSQTINCAPSIIEPDPLPVTTDVGKHFKRPRFPGNNFPKNGFKIAGTPNLIVTDTDWSPKSFNDNQKVTVTYTVKNIGNGPAEPRPSTSLNIDGNFTKVNAPGAPGTYLYPGDSKKYAYVWNAKCGAKFTITVDPGNITAESNELDNTWEHTFGPPSCNPTFIPEPPAQNLPNLNISSSRFSPLKTSWNTGTVYNFDTGDIPVDINITVRNSGNVAATTSKYQLLVNNKVIITDLIALGPNQQVNLGWYATVSCNSVFKLILDVDNSVAESNENDNSTTIGPWPSCN
jgi:subtilase family serine protease